VRAADEKAAQRKKRWRRIVLVVGPLLLGIALLAVWLAPATTSPAASEKGTLLVSTLSNSRPVRAVAAWLCTTFSVGCTATQVRPLPEDCPRETVRSMEEMDLFKGDGYHVIIDIHQLGEPTERGTYRPRPIVSKLVKYSWTGPLPEGTLLYGRLWTEGLTGLTRKDSGSKPGEARLPRAMPALPVRFWP
jgi:hypothetical protein